MPSHTWQEPTIIDGANLLSTSDGYLSISSVTTRDLVHLAGRFLVDHRLFKPQRKQTVTESTNPMGGALNIVEHRELPKP